MGSMDDKLIDMMNEDWEYVYERERAMIDAQRQYEEEMLMLQWQKEHEHFEQAKIIQEHDKDDSQETERDNSNGPGHEQSDATVDVSRQGELDRVDGPSDSE